MATSSRRPASIQDLPNEILADIIFYTDSSPPSPTRLLGEPNFEVTDSPSTPLKNLSLVSPRWRQIVLPLLFRHVRLKIWGTKYSLLSKSTLHEWFSPLGDFLTRRSLGAVVQSFALCIQSEKALPITHGPYTVIEFAKFWDNLFQIIDPTDLLIVAPVRHVGLLSGSRVKMQDAFLLDCPYHYLQLQRDGIGSDSATENAASEPDESGAQPTSTQSSTNEIPVATDHPQEPATGDIPSKLFNIRPWTKLLLNEGSFIKAYSVDSYWMREPPSILEHLFGAAAPPYTATIPATIRTLSYIGIFPIASHFSIITRHLPLLDRLYLQLVPRSNILENPSKMTNVDPEDLWMERNSCYALLMRELFNVPPTGNYRYLKEFESGDAADRDSWHMAVEYVKRAGNGWKVAGDGVFVRTPEDINEGGGGDDSLLLVN
ncbi:hypothetical protein F5884DRAFT_676331 [Xylogone sp. PMI_703]|nr:hypothetical protein F5884DRAFT_676331 [Xylogone sp. PMI_703]